MNPQEQLMAKIDAEFKKYPFKFIGERLKQERLRLGYTAKSVYERLTIAQSTYANYEKGSRDIPASLLFELWLDGFDVSFIVSAERFGSAGVDDDSEPVIRLIDINAPDERPVLVSDAIVYDLYHIENGLIKVGAIAHKDYELKDLIRLLANKATLDNS